MHQPISVLYGNWAFGIILSIFILIIFITIVGNILVFTALIRFKRLRTTANLLIGNLAISDLLLALTILPMSAANSAMGYWTLGPVLCDMWLSSDVLLCTASIWNLVAIAFDRFTATTFPIWYRGKQTTTKVSLYAIIVWVLAVCICLPAMLGQGSERAEIDSITWNRSSAEARKLWQQSTGTYVYDLNRGYYECILHTKPSYAIYSAMGALIIPLFIICGLYVKIFVTLKTRERRFCRKKTSQSSSNYHTNGITTSGFIKGFEPSNPKAVRLFRVAFGQSKELSTQSDSFAKTSSLKKDISLRSRTTSQNDILEGENKPVLNNSSKVRAHIVSVSNLCSEINQPTLDIQADPKTKTWLAQNRKNDNIGRRSSDKNSTEPNTLRVTQRLEDNIETRTTRLYKSSSSVAIRTNCTSINGIASPPTTRQRESLFFLDCKLPFIATIHNECYEYPETVALKQPLDTQERMERCSQNVISNEVSSERAYAREGRVTKRMATLIVVFVMCWLPFTLMYLIRSLCAEQCSDNIHVNNALIWLGYVNSTLNPLLYAYLNRQFRKAFGIILHIDTMVRRIKLSTNSDFIKK